MTEISTGIEVVSFLTTYVTFSGWFEGHVCGLRKQSGRLPGNEASCVSHSDSGYVHANAPYSAYALIQCSVFCKHTRSSLCHECQHSWVWQTDWMTKISFHPKAVSLLVALLNCGWLSAVGYSYPHSYIFPETKCGNETRSKGFARAQKRMDVPCNHWLVCLVDIILGVHSVSQRSIPLPCMCWSH